MILTDGLYSKEGETRRGERGEISDFGELTRFSPSPCLPLSPLLLTHALRLLLTRLSSAFCGSANFFSPSCINCFSSFASSTFVFISCSTSAGGISSTVRRKVRPLF